MNKDTPTDNIYELSCYNSNGIINRAELRRYASFIFSSLFIGIFLLLHIAQIIQKEIDITEILSVEFYKQFLDYNYLIISKFFFDGIYPPKIYITNLLLSFTIAIVPTIYFIFSKIRASRFQAILSSAGLSQYYYYKQRGKSIYLKFKKGSKNSYKNFIAQQENLTQMLKKDNLQFKRWKNNGVIIQYSDRFPTLSDLSHLKVQDFIKKDKLFLGIGLPQIGEEIQKQDLIKGKYVARYLNISDIPQGTANLGSAGGGKSNTMNQYLFSLFFNFDKIESFYMIDFKGGIEAEPIKDLELRCNTGKIQVFDDNRIELYKALKRLHFINKARMRYLKTNKRKKFTSDFIVLIFDELAEILDYTPSTKEERKVQDQISYYLESLLRTGRSQGFKIFYSTQSYLTTSSGLSSGMKNNTKLKIAHQLGSNLQVGSIKPTEELAEIGIFPTKYDVGKNVVINEADNTIYEVRSLYVPDDFINSITLNSKHNETLRQELQIHYEAVYSEMLKDLQSTGQEDDTIYSLDDIAKDLSIPVKTPEIRQKEEPVIEEKVALHPKKDIPKSSIVKTIQMKKSKKNEDDNAQFLESLK